MHKHIYYISILFYVIRVTLLPFSAAMSKNSDVWRLVCVITNIITTVAPVYTIRQSFTTRSFSAFYGGLLALFMNVGSCGFSITYAHYQTQDLYTANLILTVSATVGSFVLMSISNEEVTTELIVETSPSLI